MSKINSIAGPNIVNRLWVEVDNGELAKYEINMPLSLSDEEFIHKIKKVLPEIRQWAKDEYEGFVTTPAQPGRKQCMKRWLQRVKGWFSA